MSEVGAVTVADVWTGQPNSFAAAHYDVIIAASSWDLRSVAFARLNSVSATVILLLRYANVGVTGVSEKHYEELLNWAQTRSDLPVRVLDIDTSDIYLCWSDLLGNLQATFVEVGQPLSTLIDLCCIPRGLTLALAGTGFRSGILRSVDYFYTTAQDYVSHSSLGSDLGFNVPQGYTWSSQWVPMAVFGLSAATSGALPTHLIVSCGFEGPRTSQLVEALDPQRISLMTATGGPDSSTRLSVSNNQYWANNYRVPPERWLHLPLLDVVGAVEALKREVHAAQNISACEVRFLAVGPKPHALAMAVAHMQGAGSGVLFGQSSGRSEVSATHLGDSYIVRLKSKWSELRELGATYVG